jgi:hypothetical protein
MVSPALSVRIGALALALWGTVACSGKQANPGAGGSGGGATTTSSTGPGAGGSVPTTYTCTSTIDVATTGDDSAAGTPGAPMKTIAAAAAKATAGTCVHVHAGQYPETKTIRFSADGTAAAPIVLLSVDGPLGALIDGSANTDAEGIYIANDSIVIDGFEFKGMTAATQNQPIHFDGHLMGKGKGSAVRNCKITGGYDMLKMNQIAGDVAAAPATVIVIEHNEIYGTPQHIVGSITGAFNVRFYKNFFHDAWSAASPAGDGAVQVKGGSAHVVFDSNTFQDINTLGGALTFGDGCDATCDFDPNHFAAVADLATNNLMIRVGRAFDFGGAKDCAALDNTIVESATQTVAFKLVPVTTGSTTQDCTNTRILDNIVADSMSSLSGVVQVNGNSGAGLNLDYNLYYSSGAPVTFTEPHSIMGNPLFKNAAGGDYTPGPGSPALGAGTNLHADVPYDRNGAPRPATGPFTIGAIE